MATFLTTARMNPALAARVARAVSHKARAHHHAQQLGLKGRFASAPGVGVSRVLPLVALLFVVGLASASYVHAARLFEQDRAALVGEIELRRALLPSRHHDFFARVDGFVEEVSAETPPVDQIAPAMRAPGALDAWLGRPAVYLHAMTTELRDPRKRDDAADGSDKDAFLYCLARPPADGSEETVLSQVRGVYFAGAHAGDLTPNVHRLAGARGSLSVVSAEFEAKVRAAEETLVLRMLRKDLEAAPVGNAIGATAAELLIIVADEPSGRFARVSLVDLQERSALVRVRLPVARIGKSATAALHRAQIEGCSLAFALRRRVDEPAGG